LYPDIAPDAALGAFQVNCTLYCVVGEEFDASSWITAFCATPFNEAVSVTFSVAVTAEAVAVKPAEVEPMATVTVAGTCSELLLLESDTGIALVAAPLK
jgi:hypothetical protein